MHNLTPQAAPALYRDASPLFDVTPHSAPMLIVQGTSDTIVPPSQSLALQQKLQAARVLVQYISYKGEHGLIGLDQQQKDTIQAQVVAFLNAQEHP
jgi:dipeptidyl aminopeptidase/acylaminoacyl peptidase